MAGVTNPTESKPQALARQRALDVRVRTLVVLGGIALAIGAVWWSLSWATGMQPVIFAGTFGGQDVGLPVVAAAPVYADGRTAYRWRSGGRYIAKLYLHNSASVPITITGVDGTDAYWAGPRSAYPGGRRPSRRSGRFTTPRSCRSGAPRRS